MSFLYSAATTNKAFTVHTNTRTQLCVLGITTKTAAAQGMFCVVEEEASEKGTAAPKITIIVVVIFKLIYLCFFSLVSATNIHTFFYVEQGLVDLFFFASAFK